MKTQMLTEKKYSEAVKGIEAKWAFSFTDDWYNYILALPNDLRITYLIIVMDSQVQNGGFDQYFVNRYGQFANETIKALEVINAIQKSKLLTTALAIVNKEGLPEPLFRKLLLTKKIKSLYGDNQNKTSDSLNELDNEYYSDSENVAELLEDYLKKEG